MGCLRRTCASLFVTPFAHQAARMSELSGPPTLTPSLATSISPATPKVSSVRWICARAGPADCHYHAMQLHDKKGKGGKKDGKKEVPANGKAKKR